MNDNVDNTESIIKLITIEVFLRTYRGNRAVL